MSGFCYHCHGEELWAVDYLSESFGELTGYEPAELLESRDLVYSDLIHPQDRPRVREGIKQALAARQPFDLEYRLLQRQGGVIRVREQGSGQVDHRGALLGRTGSVTACAASRAPGPPRLDPENRFRLLFEASPDAIAVIDRDGRAVDVNPAALRMFGCDDRRQLLAAAPAELAPPLQPDGRTSRDAAVAAISQALRQGQHDVEWLLRRRDSGALFTAQVSLRRLELDGQPALLTRLSDISLRRSDEQRLRQLAYEDALTGLANRQAAVEWLTRHLARHRHGPVLILNLDLDHFEWVNNTFGRQQGDQLIRDFAQLLRRLMPPEALVARLQSDEFLVIQPLAVAGEPLDAALHLDDLRRLLTTGIGSVVQLPYLPGFCIGCRLHHGADVVMAGSVVSAEAMIQEANTALSEARRTGVNRQAVYVPEMSQWIQKTLQLEARLAQARQLQEFILHYQPIVRRDGVIVAAEALMRWPQPDGGFVSPNVFIPMLERSGGMVAVGGWLIEIACEQLAAWRQQGLLLDYLSINVSAGQLLSREISLHDQLMTAISRHELSPNLLQIEITETSVLENMELARVELERLVAAGFSVALDDFGTGYSSLLTLLQLPISSLKVDKSFVDEVDTQPKSFALVETCVSMADKLGLRCVAEGVESELQCQQLRRIGCAYFQGYLYDRPLAPADLEQRLRRQLAAADS